MNAVLMWRKLLMLTGAISLFVLVVAEPVFKWPEETKASVEFIAVCMMAASGFIQLVLLYHRKQFNLLKQTLAQVAALLLLWLLIYFLS